MWQSLIALTMESYTTPLDFLQSFSGAAHLLANEAQRNYSMCGDLDPDCYLIIGHIRDYFLSRNSHRLWK